MNRLPAPDDPCWLIKTVFSRWRWTAPAAALMILSFLSNGLTPVIVGRAVDEAIARIDFGQLIVWLLVLMAAFAVNILVGYWGRWLMQRAILQVGHDVRMAVTDRIQDPRGLGGKKRSAGELLSIASSDTQRVADAVFMTVFPFAEASAILYVGIVLLSIDTGVGIAVLFGGPAVVWIALKIATPLRKASARRQRSLARASGLATDIVHGLRVVKGLGASSTMAQRYRKVSDEAYARTIDANASQARLNATTETVGSVYVIIVAVFSGWLALSGHISVGELITAIGLTQFIIHPMTMLGRNFASRWAPAQASAQRIQEVLNAPARWVPDSRPLPDFPAGLSVVRGEVPEVLAEVERAGFVLAPHEAELFDGTVAENVHPDTKRASQALEIASASDIPGGCQRQVGENGLNLSGGQRQRVALARAIAAEAEVLVLQEPTTAVDSVTQYRIAQRVAEHRSVRCTLVFSDSPAWASVADRVLEEVSL